MKLTRIWIRNFRCIDGLWFRQRDYQSLIDPNNDGNVPEWRSSQ